MNPNIRSAIIAGVIAGVIYTVIALLTGAGAASAFGVGAIFLIGTALVTFVIATVIGRIMQGRNGSA
jgi:hypothetical protein